MKFVQANFRAVVLLFLIGFSFAPTAFAHCDTLAGPVVAAARRALDAGDVMPVLKWVRPEHEQEIRAAFDRTRNVRSQSTEARELADRYFFETLVRLHRAGEGEPFTGLKDVADGLGDCSR